MPHVKEIFLGRVEVAQRVGDQLGARALASTACTPKIKVFAANLDL
jgi:hypothetical protein